MTKCNGCYKELNKKEVVYTEDKIAYCKNPFECSDVHPNSVANIVARGGAVKMYTEDELENNIFDRLNISDEMKDRIIKVASKPQSIRLSKYEIAYYLLQLQATKELASISEAVRYCVNFTMEQEPIDVPVNDVPESEESADLIEAISGVHEALTEETPKKLKLDNTGTLSFKVPDVPKSVNVDWSKVQPADLHPLVEEKEEEDEFTF